MKSMGDKPKVRIIRMRKVSFIDSTGLHNLESLFRLSEAEHIHMILSGVNEHVHRVLTKSGFDKKIGAENICSNINEAVESESCRTRLDTIRQWETQHAASLQLDIYSGK